VNLFKKLQVQLINAGLILLIVASFVVIICISYLSVLKLLDNNYWENHTYDVISKADAIISDLLNGETGQRGYVITGEETFLAPYNEALQNVYNDFQNLDDLTQDNPAQQKRLADMKPLIDLKLAEMNDSVSLRKYKGLQPAIAAVSDGAGKKTMDSIRQIESDLKSDELKLLKQREFNSAQTATEVQLVLLWGGIGSFLLYFLINYIISKFVIKDLVSKPFLLKEKQAVFYARSLIEASLDPLITISPSGKITDLNEAAIKATGISREKLIGTDFISNFTNPEEAREGYERVFRQGSVSDYPLTIKSTEGKTMDVLLNASVYKNEEGIILGVFAAVRDYTRMKQATEAIELINREMEAFSSSVSHDLRAPLRVIDGFAKMLSEDYALKLDDEGKRIILNIQDSAKQMKTLIEDLLAFSRLGNQEIKKEFVPMGILVKEVFDELKHALPDRKIDCHIQELIDTKADRDTLRLVWTNLLSNAIKYTRPKETALIEVSSKLDNDKIIYSVKDNGVGFDMKYIDKLFNVFQRLHSSDEFEGTGVGLANVKRIIERHGGKVWAEGRVGEGATFSFSLPKI
jgi:PAS domain S-box-containing protein